MLVHVTRFKNVQEEVKKPIQSEMEEIEKLEGRKIKIFRSIKRNEKNLFRRV